MNGARRLTAEEINRLIDSQLELVDSQRRSLVLGVWLWKVPPEIRLEDLAEVPGEQWQLVEVQPGDYRGTDPKEALGLFPKALLDRGVYVIGIGEGDHFRLAMFTHFFPGEIVWVE